MGFYVADTGAAWSALGQPRPKHVCAFLSSHSNNDLIRIVPTRSWHTPRVHESDRYIEGKRDPQLLKRYLVLREFPSFFEDLSKLRVYVVSVVPNETKALREIFEINGVTMYELTSKDFFTEKCGGYSTLGVDRAAALRGALKANTEDPCLVVDCGTCMTFTASDATGFELMGGQILPGLQTIFDSMSQKGAMLPEIRVTPDLEKHLKSMLKGDKKERLDRFSKDTKQSMINGVLLSVAANIRENVLDWVFNMKK